MIKTRAHKRSRNEINLKTLVELGKQNSNIWNLFYNNRKKNTNGSIKKNILVATTLAAIPATLINLCNWDQ